MNISLRFIYQQKLFLLNESILLLLSEIPFRIGGHMMSGIHFVTDSERVCRFALSVHALVDINSLLARP